MTTVTPAQQRTLAVIEAELARLVRYDDESVVHEAWIRQRYDGGFAASYAPARAAAVRTAWHEAGHAVAALELGARFSSASIRAGAASAGRVHAIRGGGELGFVIDAAGQVAERLRDWTLPETDAEVRAWLASWRGDGGDARRFRAGIRARFGADEAAAWRYAAAALTPLRPRIRDLARALLVYPRHLPYPVTAAIAGFSELSSAGQFSRGRRTVRLDRGQVVAEQVVVPDHEIEQHSRHRETRRRHQPPPVKSGPDIRAGLRRGVNGRQESGLRHGQLPCPRRPVTGQAGIPGKRPNVR